MHALVLKATHHHNDNVAKKLQCSSFHKECSICEYNFAADGELIVPPDDTIIKVAHTNPIAIWHASPNLSCLHLVENKGPPCLL